MYREIRGRDSWIWVCFDSRRYKTWAVVPKKKENQLKQTKKKIGKLCSSKRKNESWKTCNQDQTNKDCEPTILFYLQSSRNKKPTSREHLHTSRVLCKIYCEQKRKTPNLNVKFIYFSIMLKLELTFCASRKSVVCCQTALEFCPAVVPVSLVLQALERIPEKNNK